MLVFLISSLVGLAMTYAVYTSNRRIEQARFTIIAEDAVDRIDQHINRHIALLVATDAFLRATEDVTREEFAKFIGGLELNERYEGVRKIGFARLIRTGDEAVVETQLFQNYEKRISVHPKTSQSLRVPTVLLEPNDELNTEVLGYDIFSEPTRREAVLRALKSNVISASGPIELVQENPDEKQIGFIVYMPVNDTKATKIETGGSLSQNTGFVYAPFSAIGLHKVALERYPILPVLVQTNDVTDGNNVNLYQSPNFDDNSVAGQFSSEKTIEIAGRKWKFSFRSTAEFNKLTSYFSVYMLGSVCLLFAMALAASTHSHLRLIEAARRVKKISVKVTEEKDILLQEMKHRIKNSIARIIAISRQTAANSETIEDFTTSFFDRLTSMASSLDMLTRSSWSSADLRDLLCKELEQVFGDNLENTTVDGPDVELNERATQALGLVFHELATNALKYGDATSEDGDLSVTWKIVGRNKTSRLVIEWLETSKKSVDEPKIMGFGSKLINVNVIGELNGEIHRSYEKDGLRISIAFPYKSAIRS